MRILAARMLPTQLWLYTWIFYTPAALTCVGLALRPALTQPHLRNARDLLLWPPDIILRISDIRKIWKMGNLLVLVSPPRSYISVCLSSVASIIIWDLTIVPIPVQYQNARHQQRRWQEKQVNIARLPFLTPFSRSNLQYHCYAGVTINQPSDSIRNSPSSDQTQPTVRDVNPSTHCSHSCPIRGRRTIRLLANSLIARGVNYGPFV